MWFDLISDVLGNRVKFGICILLYACVVLSCEVWYTIVGIKVGLTVVM